MARMQIGNAKNFTVRVCVTNKDLKLSISYMQTDLYELLRNQDKCIQRRLEPVAADVLPGPSTVIYFFQEKEDTAPVSG